jgi:CHAT domain-containing protein/Tfp pilus assembly protein PilF
VLLILSALTLSLLQAHAAAPGAPEEGAVVEEVTAGWAGAAAGLQPGDIILSWSCPASPPALPQPSSGIVRSPYDLLPLEIEEAPRRAVTLRGQRGDREITWILTTSEWGIAARPGLPKPLEAVYVEGKASLAAGDLPAAERLWRSAAESAQAAGEERLAAWLVSQLSTALAEAGKWLEADAASGQALAALERASESPAAAQLLRDWGKTFERRARWDEAIDRYRKALAFDRAAAPETLAAARTLDALGVAVAKSGSYPAAEALLLQALAMREKLAPETTEVAWSFNNLGALARLRGDLTRAEGFLTRGEKLQRRLDSGNAHHALLLQSLGNLAGDRGDLEKAEGLYRQALAILEKTAPGSDGIAGCLRSLGSVASQRGDLAAADDLLRRSLALQERRPPHDLRVSATLINLGVVAWQRGALQEAEAYYRRALEIQEKLSPQGREAASSLVNLGLVASLKGDFATARADLGRSLEILEKLAPESVDVAVALENLGWLEAGSGGDLDKAEGLLQRALKILEKEVPESEEASSVVRHLGEIAARRGRLAEAAALHRRALDLQRKAAPGTTGEAEALYFLGQTELRSGRSEEGTRDLCRAIDILDRQRGRIGGTQEARSSFEATLGDYYQACLESLTRLGRTAEAFHVLERSRARSFLALLAERDLHLSDLPPELDAERRHTNAEYDRVQSQLARSSSGRDDAETLRLTDKLRDLRAHQEEILARIRRKSPRSAALEAPKPLDLAGTRAILDPGTVLLEYAVGSERTWLFVVQPAGTAGPGLAVVPIPAGAKTLREEVESFRRALKSPDSERAALQARARRLYGLLIQPAEAQLAHAQRLLISPAGPLHTLPFAALLRNDGWLVEWKPVHSVLSATVYAALLPSRPPQRQTGGTLAAFGDPLYPRPQPKAPAGSEGRGSTFQSLPFSRDEVKAIAALYPRAQVYLGQDATEEKAKTLGPGSRLIHFACHGVLDERFPLNSALALTIPEHPGEGQDNGLLQAWEIFESVRLDADLVTLSACDSALGQEMGGEGLLGLTRAFQYAGARSVLGSLWSINDRSTGALMKRFYRHLRAGETKDEALQAAQIELIRTPHFSHPFHWAAFQLAGDWR